MSSENTRETNGGLYLYPLNSPAEGASAAAADEVSLRAESLQFRSTVSLGSFAEVLCGMEERVVGAW